MPRFVCPSCGGNKFIEGPHGGMAVNFCCANCWRRFNDMGPFGIMRGGFVLECERHFFSGPYVPASLAALTILARQAVEGGAGHDCSDWPTADDTCALCGRPVNLH